MLKLKNPTREQKKHISKMNLNPADWFVERDTPKKIVLVHRYSDKTKREIHKEKKDED